MFVTPNKKVNALIPSVREELCLNHQWRWTGNIPCTGVEKCSMCNMVKSETVTKEMIDRINGAIIIAFGDLNDWEWDYGKRPHYMLKDGIEKRQKQFEDLLADKAKMMGKHLISESGKEEEMFVRQLTNA